MGCRCFLALLLAFPFLSSCAVYPTTITQKEILPADNGGKSAPSGKVWINARPYKYERKSLDFREAGVYPVQVIVTNRSGEDCRVNLAETKIVGSAGIQYPPMDTEQAAETVEAYLNSDLFISKEQALTHPLSTDNDPSYLIGSVFAIIMTDLMGNSQAGSASVMSMKGHDSKEESIKAIKRTMLQTGFSSEPVKPGETKWGWIYFSGDATLQHLEFSLVVGGESNIVILDGYPSDSELRGPSMLLVRTDPPMGKLYAGKDESSLIQVGSTPFLFYHPKWGRIWSAECYKVTCKGYKDSKVICCPAVDGDRILFVELEKLPEKEFDSSQVSRDY